MQQLGNSIRQGTLWLVTGSIGYRVLTFLFGVVLAHLLAPKDFGVLVAIQVFTGAAGFIAGGGMGQALIQSKDVDHRHFHVVFTLQLFICSAIYAVFCILAPWLAVWFDNPIYTDLMRVSALSFLIRPFMNIAQASLRREMRFKAIVIINNANLVVTSSASIALAVFGFGVWSLVLGGIIGGLFQSLCFILVSKRYPGFHYDAAIAKTLGSYGIKFSVNEIIYYLKGQTPNFLLSTYSGPSATGLFNKGSSLSALPIQTISGSAYQTVFKALSASQDNLDKSKYIYLRTISLVSVYTFPFYIALLWLSEPFIVTVYGAKWQAASIPLQILSIAGLFRCISNPSGAVLAAQNLLGIEIKLQVVALFLTVVGCLPGIQHNDITLIALGLLPSSVFLAAALSFCALRALKIGFMDLLKALKPAVFLNFCLALVMVACDQVLMALEMNSDPIVYLTTLACIGGLVYFMLFLFYPLRSIETEVLRWKKILRLGTESC